MYVKYFDSTSGTFIWRLASSKFMTHLKSMTHTFIGNHSSQNREFEETEAANGSIQSTTVGTKISQTQRDLRAAVKTLRLSPRWWPNHHQVTRKETLQMVYFNYLQYLGPRKAGWKQAAYGASFWDPPYNAYKISIISISYLVYPSGTGSPQNLQASGYICESAETLEEESDLLHLSSGKSDTIWRSSCSNPG